MAKSLVSDLPGASLITLTFKATLHHLQGPHSVSFPTVRCPSLLSLPRYTTTSIAVLSCLSCSEAINLVTDYLQTTHSLRQKHQVEKETISFLRFRVIVEHAFPFLYFYFHKSCGLCNNFTFFP